MTNDTNLSTRSCKRLIKSVTNKRVSDEASDELAEEMEQLATAISQKAVDIARRNDRITVRDGDISQAIREMKKMDIEISQPEVEA